MPDRSHGSAYLSLAPDTAYRVLSQTYNPQVKASVLARVAGPTTRVAPPTDSPAFMRVSQPAGGAERVRRAASKKRRRAWVQRAGETSAATPMWTTRRAWLDGLRSWATAEVVHAVTARLACSMTAATLLTVAAVMADYADHASGRNMAATRATIARRVGCSPRTVTTAWRILRETGWTMEASRGHGGAATPTFGRRPSVWHLIPRRPEAVEFFHLPPLSRESGLTPVGKNSPRARQRAPQQDPSPKPTVKRWRATPRPLPLQRLAAQLAVRCRGLDRGHIGALCDALDTAGIDPQHWTARQLTDALNDDMRTRGWSWPDHIERPGGFLISRLRRLTEGGKAARPDKNPQPATPTPPQYIPETRPTLTPEQQARIAEIRAGIRAQLATRKSSVGPTVTRPAAPPRRAGLAGVNSRPSSNSGQSTSARRWIPGGEP